MMVLYRLAHDLRGALSHVLSGRRALPEFFDDGGLLWRWVEVSGPPAFAFFRRCSARVFCRSVMGNLCHSHCI